MLPWPGVTPFIIDLSCHLPSHWLTSLVVVLQIKPPPAALVSQTAVHVGDDGTAHVVPQFCIHLYALFLKAGPAWHFGYFGWFDRLHSACLASQMALSPGCSTSVPAPCFMCLGRQQRMAHVLGPCTYRRDPEVAAGFSLAQSWLLRQFGRWTSIWVCPLSVLLCFFFVTDG